MIHIKEKNAENGSTCHFANSVTAVKEYCIMPSSDEQVTNVLGGKEKSLPEFFMNKMEKSWEN